MGGDKLGEVVEACCQEENPCFLGSRDLVELANMKFCEEFGTPWMQLHSVFEHFRLILQQLRLLMKQCSGAANYRKDVAESHGDVAEGKRLKKMRNDMVRMYKTFDNTIADLGRLGFMFFVASVTSRVGTIPCLTSI